MCGCVWAGCRKALVGTRWAISLSPLHKEQFSSLVGPPFVVVKVFFIGLDWQHWLRDVIIVNGLGLGKLCLNLPVLFNSWKCNYYASEEAVLWSHYAQLCNFDPRAGPSHLL